MIVAIAIAGTGQVNVEEFRVAADTATAVSDFCNEYTPSLDPSAYVGFDIGAEIVPRAGVGKRWSFDHDTRALVATAVQPVPGLPLPLHTKAELSALPKAEGYAVYVTDEASTVKMAVCDGTNWRLVTDGTIVV